MSPRLTGAAIWLGLALRVGIACWNAFDGPSLGAGVDAVNFQRFAVAFAEGRTAPGVGLTGFSYAYSLGLVYRITGPSLFLGSLISCAAWLGSAFLLRASLRLLSAGDTAQLAGLMIYSVLPSSVLWTAVTLREPYEMLSVNAALYAVIRLLERFSAWAWMVLLAALVLGAMLHVSHIVFAAFVVGMLLLRWLWKMPRSMIARSANIGLAMALMAATAFVAVRTLYDKYDFSGGPSAAIARHIESGMLQGSRTVYKDSAKVDGSAGLALVVPVAMFQYLFEPMPWRMNRLIDAGVLLENLLRGALIGMALLATWRLQGSRREKVIFILAGYLAIELTWAIGTFNWGTAARHHLPATGLLVAAALAYSADWARPARDAAATRS